MKHELHAARFVEEPFEHERLLGRQHAERFACGREVSDGLIGCGMWNPGLCGKPGGRLGERVRGGRAERRFGLQPLIRFGAEIADSARQLVAASRGFAEPEGNRRRCAFRVGHAYCSGGDLQDAPGGVAELKDVARRAFDCEILVQRAHKGIARIEDNPVVRDFRNGAAGGRGKQSRAAAALEAVADFVAVNEGGAAATARLEPLRRDGNDGVEVAPVEISIRPRAARQREQLVFAALDRGRFGHDLLRQNVERRIVRHDAVQLAAAERSQQRRAFDEIVARDREQAALRDAGDRVTGSADALNEGRDPMRGPNLTDEIDASDIDSELERRRGNERSELPALQPRFSVQALFLGQAAVVRRDRGFVEPLTEMTREPFREPPCVHEHERCAMRADERRQAVVVLLPDFVRHHRFERRSGQLDT